METKLVLSCAIGCLMISSALVAVGCGDDAKGHPASTASGGEAAGGAAAMAHGGDATSQSQGGTPEPGSTGPHPHVDPTNPDQPGGPDMPGAAGSGADSPDFDGVDLSEVPETPPRGCVGAFDPDTGTLSLTLGDDASIVRVAVHAGVVQANGVDCESEAGDPAAADNVLTLDVAGSAGDDVLYLDLSDEPFSGCFSADGAIAIDLGEGADRVTVLGTLDADVFHAGSDMDTLVLDADGDDRVDVSIGGTPALLLSTGAKDDEVRCDGAALGVDPVALPLSVYGGGARDVLMGGAGDDRLFGGIGNDWFDAGTVPAGADVIDGGDGSDVIDFSARTAALSVTVGTGADDGEAGEGADVGDSVEGVYGGQAKNEITGGSASSYLWGGPDDDVIAGGDGDDVLNGGGGADKLKGEAGNDYLYGEDGDDDLDGGIDDDLLDAGMGKNSLNAGPGDGDICIADPKKDQISGCEL